MTLEKLHDEAKKIMLRDLRENHEITLTAMAENAAIELENDEWLDDSDHWIWELAVEVCDEQGVEI